MLLTNARLFRPLPLHIGSIGRFNNAPDMIRAANQNSFGSSGWPGANRAKYIPVQIPARFTVARFFVANGIGVAGNFDIGLYDNSGNRLISTGATAQSGANVVQYVGVTDQSFPPGHYYLALVLSSTSGEVRRANVDQYQARMTGALMENLGATTLPVTMTPVSYTTNNLFFFGFTQSDSL